MGRPEIPIDENLVEKLANIMCTMEEIAHVVGCSVDTLERRFAETIKQGRSKGKMTLRRWQWQACEKGNPALLIWMGKQHLGQAEPIKIDVSGANKSNTTVHIAFDPSKVIKKK